MSFRDLLSWTALFGDALAKARKATALRSLGAAGRIRARAVVRPGEVVLHAPFSGEPSVFWAVAHVESMLTTQRSRNGGDYDAVIERQHFRSGAVVPFDLVGTDGEIAAVEIEAGTFEAATLDPLIYSVHGHDEKLAAAWQATQEPPARDVRWRDGGDELEVEVGPLTWFVTLHRVTDCERLNAMPRDLEAFFRHRGVVPTPFMGLVREHRLLEARIGVGSPVEIIGDAREGMSGSGEGYRGGSPRPRITPIFVDARSTLPLT